MTIEMNYDSSAWLHIWMVKNSDNEWLLPILSVKIFWSSFSSLNRSYFSFSRRGLCFSFSVKSLQAVSLALPFSCSLSSVEIHFVEKFQWTASKTAKILIVLAPTKTGQQILRGRTYVCMYARTDVVRIFEHLGLPVSVDFENSARWFTIFS